MKTVTEEGTLGCVVPIYREFKVVTLNGILKQAKVTVEDFIESL
jgi:hypothetical protein